MHQLQPLANNPEIRCTLNLHTGRLHLQFPATQTDVSEALGMLHQSLLRMEIAPQDVEKAELTLAEALNNVIEHAARPDQDTHVSLGVERKKDKLICLIKDKGKPMPGEKPPAGEIANIDVSRPLLPEGGFGWGMIRHFTQSLNYRRIQGENRLELTLPLLS